MRQGTIKIAPSNTRLGEEVAEAERCGADRIHVDAILLRIAGASYDYRYATCGFFGSPTAKRFSLELKYRKTRL